MCTGRAESDLMSRLRAPAGSLFWVEGGLHRTQMDICISKQLHKYTNTKVHKNTNTQLDMR